MSDGKAATIGLGAATIASTVGGALLTSRLKGREQRTGVSLMGLDPRDGTTIVLPERTLQWWPESLSDTIALGWTEKLIPGGSHSLQQWGGNGGRTISFEIPLTRNMRLKETLTAAQGAGPGSSLLDPDNTRNRPFNTNIPAAIAYLRAFCYPEYDDSGAIAPPICLLNVPGHKLNENGSDTIWCVMTGCDVTYKHSFDEGEPRLASVALTFMQIVQKPKGTNNAAGVLYKQRSDLYSSDARSSPSRGDWVTSRERNNPDKNNP